MSVDLWTHSTPVVVYETSSKKLFMALQNCGDCLDDSRTKYNEAVEAYNYDRLEEALARATESLSTAQSAAAHLMCLINEITMEIEEESDA